MIFPRGFHAHAEAGLASGRQGRISSQNTTVGYTNYSNQPQVRLLNQGVYNISCSPIILNSNGRYGTCNIVFVKSKGTDHLCILSEPVINHRALRCSCAWAVRTGEIQSPQSGYTTYGGVGRFVIHVNECSFHVRKDLNRILKLLANIVRFPQRCARVHDDVDLNEVVWAALSYAIR